MKWPWDISQPIHKPEHELWRMIDDGKIQTSKGRIAIGAGALLNGTVAAMFSLPPGMEAPMQDLFMLTLVPPIVSGPVGGDGGPFYGYETQPTLNLFALVRHGTQTAPITLQVDFERGVTFPVYGPYISVLAVNESATAFTTQNGPSCFISKGAFSSGIPRRAIQGLFGGAPISLANLLTSGSISDKSIIPPSAQFVTVLVSPPAQSIVDPAIPVNTFVLFYDIAGNLISGAEADGSNPIPIVVPADAARIALYNLSNGGGIVPPAPNTSLNSVRFVFTNSP